MFASEYLITKYGNGKAVPPESGFVDNIYCEFRYIYISGSIRYYTIYLIPPLVSHYAEGTLMPVLFQRMVFEYVPKNSPFWIRPIIRPVFKQLEELLVKPEIKNNLAMVCISGYLFIDERKN